jgi:hypothetical protein
MEKTMRPTYWLIGTLTVLAALLAGCGVATAPQPTLTTQPIQPTLVQKTMVATRVVEPPQPAATAVPLVEEIVKQPGATPFPTDGALKDLAASARDDLAKRLSVPAAQIDLLELSQVTWPDGSLGCPKPGMMYTQSLVDGVLIRLRAGEAIYEYHSGGSGAAFYCEKPRKALPDQTR